MVKVLVADDDEGIVESVSLILKDEGYKVVTIMQGDQVAKKVAEFKPDILLLDILMSGYDGRDICRHLKADEKTRSLPVIMFSAHPQARGEADICGADAFLPKPFEIDELLELVKRFTEK